METHLWYLMGLKLVQAANTFIGGVSGNIGTPALLASKIAIDVSRISNFSIVGSDIKCTIMGSYELPISAFTNNLFITYYRDLGLCTSYESNTFAGAENLEIIDLIAVTSLKNTAGSFIRNYKLHTIYNPNCISYGSTVVSNSIFVSVGFTGCKIYTHPSMATINAGGVEGDLSSAIANGQIVRYISNRNLPNAVNDLSALKTYNTTVQINFSTPIGSVNSIDFYELYINGIYSKKILSGDYITGLSKDASYIFTVKAVDVFYNKSVLSNAITVVPNFTYTDADALAYFSASTLTTYESKDSFYQLIVDLKSNLLYTKTQAIYPLKGTTAAQHKFNAKNPVDSDAGFRLTFTGAATFSELGYQLNGASHANTHLMPSVSQSLNSNGFTVVCGTNIQASGDNWAIAAYNSGTQNSILSLLGNGAFNLNGSRFTGASVLGQKGIFTATKQSATVSKLFKNGVLKLSGNSGGTLPTNPFYIGAIGNISYGYIQERIQMVVIHEGLSDLEVATLHSIIDLSETIAGRKTW